MSRRHRLPLAVLGVVATLLVPVGGSAQTEEELAAELAIPLPPTTTLVAQYRGLLGVGPDDDTNHEFRFNPSFFVPRRDGSAFLVRTSLPILARNWPAELSGLGDTNLTPYFVPDASASDYLAYGAALRLPTATDDALGSGKASAGPAFLYARVGRPATWGALVQHLESVLGDEDRADVGVTTVQPFVNLLLGRGWALLLTSETTYDWERSDDEVTVPIRLGASKVVAMGERFVRLGAAWTWYAAGPETLPEGRLRLAVNYVIR